jgi:hypothetical protein
MDPGNLGFNLRIPQYPSLGIEFVSVVIPAQAGIQALHSLAEHEPGCPLSRA